LQVQSPGQVSQFSPFSGWQPSKPQLESGRQSPLLQASPLGHPQSSGQVLQFSPYWDSQISFLHLDAATHVPLSSHCSLVWQAQSAGQVLQFSVWLSHVPLPQPPVLA
jgi:hypothetical protein